MVAGNIDDLRALMSLAEKFVKNLTDRFVPVPAFVKFPPIDDIADQIQCLAFGFLEKIEKGWGIECFCADVKIGQEDGAEIIRLLRVCVWQTGQPFFAIKLAAIIPDS